MQENNKYYEELSEEQQESLHNLAENSFFFTGSLA